jgi:AcrR family transcriptional regulator
MGRTAKYSKEQFVEAALDIVATHGPAAATVSAIARRLGAPIGSVYHRFPSRDILLATVWLRIIESYQREFLETLEQGDGLEAALFGVRWVREHPNEARILLLYRREELISGEWPDEVRKRTNELAEEITQRVLAFTRRLHGRATQAALRRTRFALFDVPLAAVLRHIQAGESPPSVVDQLVRDTYFAILGEESSPL